MSPFIINLEWKRVNLFLYLYLLREVILIALSLLSSQDSAYSLTQEFIYFQGTEYELHVYKIQGTEKGKTLLIIGGIQGNEPGGYLAADLYVDMALKKGTLIVVPRANFSSIIRDVRGVNGDMNRKFAGVSVGDGDKNIVHVLRELIAESDYLLNLHDGMGFYSEQWESDLRNPKRYGQSIIADCEEYNARGKNEVLHLGEIARKVCEEVNAQIEHKEYHFRFNNHRTAERDTLHSEQRTSATFYALTHHEIPAFGIETSKNIESCDLRVKLQTMVINAFMKEFDIVPEHPRIYLDPPRLEYLVITINKAHPLVVYDAQTLLVREGDCLEVSHIEANYERGLSVDIVGVGSNNDYRRNICITEPTEIMVKKDKFNCGKVFLGLTQAVAQPSAGGVMASRLPAVDYLVIEINQTAKLVSLGDQMEVVKGDHLKIVDVLGDHLDTPSLKVNFKGFVSDPLNNTGEDRGYMIDTSKDLWGKYSQDALGTRYPIVVSLHDGEVGRVWVDVIEPRFDYVVVRLNGGVRMCFAPQEEIEAHFNDVMEIVDVKTNVPGNEGVMVNFRGFVHDANGDDRGKPILLNDALLKRFSLEGKGYEYEIVVERGDIFMGKVKVHVASPKENKLI